ncbi:AAA family ATPase [Candidatus Parcubacteria bacterium]|nr:AAA family ATPase [Candidatus Parcubacteria bacterium]
MYLKKLEISGFKSFANKTVLDFPHGITAVVGPNGSGKSNVADAIKWVLGEQSMKSLRGKKSKDVIFTGSDKKAKMSSASVSLHLDNRDKKIPLDYEDVILTRKLFQNGDSEYLINKSRARLIDIIDLLARSGVSQRGYCVINQGMADSILTATPAERMVIFEEATGVRKFQIKKQQSINKLESTKRNLQRVADLLNEIEPRLNSLKRQASKAQKRGAIEESLKSEQKKLFAYIWTKLNNDNRKYGSEKENLEKNIKEYSEEVAKIKNKLSETENNSDSYTTEFEQLQKEIDSLRETINELQRNLSVIEGRLQIEEERKKEMEKPEHMPINLGYVKNKLYGLVSAYDKFFDLIKKIANLEDIESIKEEGIEVRKNVKNLLKEIEDGKITQKDKEIVFDDSSIKKLKTEKVEVSNKIRGYEKEYEEFKNRIYELNKNEQEKRQIFFQLEKNLQIKQDELNKFKDVLNQINIELAKFEVRKEDLINEIKDEIGNNEILKEIQDRTFKNSSEEFQFDSFDQEESRLKIRKLKIQFDQIGGIDPLIMEEYEETKKRFDFLSAQSNDLEQASGSLKKVIEELDEKIEVIFKSSFKKISEEFNKYFKIIFGGGKADLSVKYSDFKKDENNGNENDPEKTEENKQEKQKIAGVEINASPPGKKISSLDILSGGERALTSVAILFAIISNNPPPFLVLDEIDAALDESNSEKIAKISKEVAFKTQLIIITHNREMMRQAGVLYGVTMDNNSISKIISLKLDEV